jgi:hypothetical protein
MKYRILSFVVGILFGIAGFVCGLLVTHTWGYPSTVFQNETWTQGQKYQVAEEDVVVDPFDFYDHLYLGCLEEDNMQVFDISGMLLYYIRHWDLYLVVVCPWQYHPSCIVVGHSHRTAYRSCRNSCGGGGGGGGGGNNGEDNEDGKDGKDDEDDEDGEDPDNPYDPDDPGDDPEDPYDPPYNPPDNPDDPPYNPPDDPPYNPPDDPPYNPPDDPDEPNAPVPEPGTVLLFGTGLVVFSLKFYKGRK